MRKPDKLLQEDSSASGSKQVDDGIGDCTRQDVLKEKAQDIACDIPAEESKCSLRALTTEASENHGRVELSSSQNGCSKGTLEHEKNPIEEVEGNAERIEMHFSPDENLQMPELENCISDRRSLDGNVGSVLTPEERKMNGLDLDSDASGRVESKDLCITIADAVSTSSTGCAQNKVDVTCGICSKRQRYIFSLKSSLFSFIMVLFKLFLYVGHFKSKLFV